MDFLWSQKAILLPLLIINICGLVLCRDPNCYKLGNIADWAENAICKIGKEGEQVEDAMTREYIKRMKKSNMVPKCLREFKLEMLDMDKIRGEIEKNTEETNICGVPEERKEELLKELEKTAPSGKRDFKEFYIAGCFYCPIPSVKLEIYGVKVLDIFEPHPGLVHVLVYPWLHGNYDPKNYNFAYVGRLLQIETSPSLLLRVRHNCHELNYQVYDYIHLDRLYAVQFSRTLIYPAKRVKLCTRENGLFCRFDVAETACSDPACSKQFFKLVNNIEKAPKFTSFPNVDPADDIIKDPEEKKRELKEENEKSDKN